MCILQTLHDTSVVVKQHQTSKQICVVWTKQQLIWQGICFFSLFIHKFNLLLTKGKYKLDFFCSFWKFWFDPLQNKREFELYKKNAIRKLSKCRFCNVTSQSKISCINDHNKRLLWILNENIDVRVLNCICTLYVQSTFFESRIQCIHKTVY